MSYSGYVSWAAQQYGTDPGVLNEINQLENSGRDTFDINDRDSNAAKGTPSGGPFQFIAPTFDAYAKQARAANPGAWKGVAFDWKDPKAQALAAAWAIKNGKGSAWTTYQRALKKAGKAPAASARYGLKAAPATNSARPAAPVSPSRSYSSLFDGGNDQDDWFASQMDRGSTALRQHAARQQAAAPVVEPGAHDDHAHGAQPKRAVGSDYKGLLKLGGQFGLRIDGSNQTTGGQHSKGSLHYSGKAVDFGDGKNHPDKLKALAAYAKANPGQFKEFFYDPLGWYIKNGKVIKGAIGGHGDHVHAAVH